MHIPTEGPTALAISLNKRCSLSLSSHPDVIDSVRFSGAEPRDRGLTSPCEFCTPLLDGQSAYRILFSPLCLQHLVLSRHSVGLALCVPDKEAKTCVTKLRDNGVVNVRVHDFFLLTAFKRRV